MGQVLQGILCCAIATEEVLRGLHHTVDWMSGLLMDCERGLADSESAQQQLEELQPHLVSALEKRDESLHELTELQRSCGELRNEETRSFSSLSQEQAGLRQDKGDGRRSEEGGDRQTREIHRESRSGTRTDEELAKKLTTTEKTYAIENTNAQDAYFKAIRLPMESFYERVLEADALCAQHQGKRLDVPLHPTHHLEVARGQGDGDGEDEDCHVQLNGRSARTPAGRVNVSRNDRATTLVLEGISRSIAASPMVLPIPMGARTQSVFVRARATLKLTNSFQSRASERQHAAEAGSGALLHGAGWRLPHAFPGPDEGGENPLDAASMDRADTSHTAPLSPMKAYMWSL
eukprot:CAMPEP_0114630104 /NCGR_PEP_ID=MMETSP0168-20121206/13710_1 /TAXON_ID=95228 ORGANISM="Vannella sp., Strain DIVA3 517/6/12" /NCGR_SAMPLE_ID=MMETSP0168 /ASSEMBLY_ACC=CAM_ASM_000044 /LENGTH=347 /DNA_ID=CAMNT_0001841599 /DNA_START=54 /DNA_END=1099 /DNA_ORIENTATION=+